MAKAEQQPNTEETLKPEIGTNETISDTDLPLDTKETVSDVDIKKVNKENKLPNFYDVLEIDSTLGKKQIKKQAQESYDKKYEEIMAKKDTGEINEEEAAKMIQKLVDAKDNLLDNKKREKYNAIIKEQEATLPLTPKAEIKPAKSPSTEKDRAINLKIQKAEENIDKAVEAKGKEQEVVREVLDRIIAKEEKAREADIENYKRIRDYGAVRKSQASKKIENQQEERAFGEGVLEEKKSEALPNPEVEKVENFLNKAKGNAERILDEVKNKQEADVDLLKKYLKNENDKAEIVSTKGRLTDKRKDHLINQCEAVLEIISERFDLLKKGNLDEKELIALRSKISGDTIKQKIVERKEKENLNAKQAAMENAPEVAPAIENKTKEDDASKAEKIRKLKEEIIKPSLKIEDANNFTELVEILSIQKETERFKKEKSKIESFIAHTKAIESAAERGDKKSVEDLIKRIKKESALKSKIIQLAQEATIPTVEVKEVPAYETISGVADETQITKKEKTRSFKGEMTGVIAGSLESKPLKGAKSWWKENAPSWLGGDKKEIKASKFIKKLKDENSFDEFYERLDKKISAAKTEKAKNNLEKLKSTIKDNEELIKNNDDKWIANSDLINGVALLLNSIKF